MEDYLIVLRQIRDLLHRYGVAVWPQRLDEWIHAIQDGDDESRMALLAQIYKALSGMGSIGDIVFHSEGENFSRNEQIEIERANAELLDLVNSADLKIRKILESSRQ